MVQNTAYQEEELLLEAGSNGHPDDHADDYHASEHHGVLGYGEAEIVTSPFIIIGKVVLGIAALAWAGFAIYLFVQRDFILPGVEQIPYVVTVLSMPLILIAVLLQLLLRTSVGEADRFARISRHLRNESEALDIRLAIVNQQLETARTTMREQAELLEQFGASASLNLETTAAKIAEQATASAEKAEILERTGLAIAHQFGQLIDSFLAVEERAQRIATTLNDGGDMIGEKVDRLQGRLESLSKLTEEARSRTLSATQSLIAQLMQVQDSSRSASEEVNGMADISANRVSATVEEVRQALDQTGATLETHMSTLSTLIGESRDALDSIGNRAVSTFGENIGDIETRLRDLDIIIKDQAQLLSGFGEDLTVRMDVLGQQFRDIENEGLSSTQRLTQSVEDLTQRTQKLDEALQSGNMTAENMIARSESLLMALDSTVRELDESHPAALSRLDDRIEQTRKVLTAIMPEIEQMEAISAAIHGRARDTEELLSGQGRKLAAWLGNGEQALASSQEQVASLHAAIQTADADAKRLIDSSGPQLVATLLRIKEMAEQAGERARQALGRAITEATDELGEASEKALGDRLSGTFQLRIEEVSNVADRAVQAAHAASDRLMRQLLTIADTTASIEQRIAEAEDAAEKREQDSFSRRSASLIESLHSASIDISKVLAEDVSDESWAAYLQGDRGVFTRRAVRLLDAGDAHNISQLYQADEMFRDGVNRYIHDFESMLRNVLATRDGSSLGVTLLSSDIGKLYVALAQAIDRLRT